jgi:endonuclease/exonuclease/phosphatase family metal-dependent hydrolase
LQNQPHGRSACFKVIRGGTTNSSLNQVNTMPPTARLLLWNIQWRRKTSPHGRTISEAINSHEPDLICITEGHTDFCDGDHVVTSEANYGYPLRPNRRKVILWSRTGWLQVDTTGSQMLPPGRFVAGTTETPVGPLRILGICIPWADAHVSSGSRDRTKWEDHSAFLAGLGPIVAAPEHRTRTVLLGDFNQRVPPKYEPARVSEALEKALGRLCIATSGIIPGVERPSIDHLAHTPDLEVVRVGGLSNRDAHGGKLTDHIGLVVEIGARRNAPTSATERI